jgi:hypothetical protein
MPSAFLALVQTSKPPNSINQAISEVWILPIDFPVVLSHIRLNIAKAPPNWVQNWAIGKQLIYPEAPPLPRPPFPPLLPAHIKHPLTPVYTSYPL